MKADTRARTQGFTFAARLHREKEAQARLLIVSQDRQNAKAQRREERRVKEKKKDYYRRFTRWYIVRVLQTGSGSWSAWRR